MDPPSSTTDDSKAWKCRMSQRLDTPARIIVAERVSAIVAQGKEGEEGSPGRHHRRRRADPSPASVAKAPTQTEGASPGMQQIFSLPQGRRKRNLVPPPTMLEKKMRRQPTTRMNLDPSASYPPSEDQYRDTPPPTGPARTSRSKSRRHEAELDTVAAGRRRRRTLHRQTLLTSTNLH